jgi:hypothetical protein
VLAVTETDAWQRNMRPVCDTLDAARPFFLYTSEEKELVLLFGRLEGRKTVKDARRCLADDMHAEDRRLLGLTEDRTWKGGLPRKRRVGVPSEKTLCYHRRAMPAEKRLAIYRAIFEELRDSYLALATDDEKTLIGMDGTELPTHYTPRHSKRRRRNKDGMPFEPTCLDGGTRRGVDGYQAVAAPNSKGICLAYRFGAINVGEADLGIEVVDELRDVVFKRLPGDVIPVITTDAGFNSPALRIAIRRNGAVENIQILSTKDDAKTRNAVAKAKNNRIAIHRHPNWKANGLREVFCRCGAGKTRKNIERLADGSISVGVIGSCSTCGPISLTGGDWVRTTGPNAPFRKRRKSDPVERIDMLGSPLTYRDPVSRVYRAKRMGHNEGFFGALSSRFGVTRNRGWYRTQTQAETAFLQAVIPTLALAVLRKKMQQGHAGPAAPPPPLKL